jgi:arylformamidase
MSFWRGKDPIERSGDMEIYDISGTLQQGIPVWPGDPELRVQWTTRIRDGGSCNIAAVNMGLHTGTHLDAPLHLDDFGSDAAGIPIRSCIGPARVCAVPAKKCIHAADLRALNWRGVERVLFKTRPECLPKAHMDPNYAYLADDASEFLAGLGILLVGTDAPSVDAFDSVSLTSHRILLGRGIAILEEARLEEVLPGDYELICLPLKFAGVDGSPVRAVLLKAPLE